MSRWTNPRYTHICAPLLPITLYLYMTWLPRNCNPLPSLYTQSSSLTFIISKLYVPAHAQNPCKGYYAFLTECYACARPPCRPVTEISITFRIPYSYFKLIAYIITWLCIYITLSTLKQTSHALLVGYWVSIRPARRQWIVLNVEW